MNAFLTGSHAYGKPNDKSDIDLVILVDEVTAARLETHNESGHPSVIRFGKLNLIICTTDAQFAAWKTGTRMCEHKARTEGPVDRERAKELLDKLKEAMGIEFYEQSPSETE